MCGSLTRNFTQIGEINAQSGEKNSLMTANKIRLSLHRFLGTRNHSVIFVDVSCAEFYANRTSNVENTANVSFTPLSKV
jgi:hypothetical protein